MNTILTFVFRHSLGDCTNNGLTSREDSIILHFGSNLQTDLIPDDELILVERTLFGKQANYAVPAGIFKSGRHSMAGGNFIYTSDSRFPSDAPISVHDRVEKSKVEKQEELEFNNSLDIQSFSLS
jgi:hypothetical protein|tara:strand:+ start:328 stop:702 length:375 start_codon:yes stop_codon:yes gene_type:complete